MTREEILKELNYKGKYTKEVKRKLKRLLKKFHPDKNNNDKETILILYQIKKELETNTLVHDELFENIKSDESDYSQNGILTLFFEKMIKSLKNNKKEIDKKIQNLYVKINLKLDKVNKKQEDLNEVKLEIEECEVVLSNIYKIDIIDKVITIIILVLFSLMLCLKIIYPLIIVFFLFIIEIYYIYIRYVDYSNKLSKLFKIKKKYKRIKKEFIEMNEDIRRLEEKEIKLKEERVKINNDIQFYTHELSKIVNKDNIKTNVDENKNIKNMKR